MKKYIDTRKSLAKYSDAMTVEDLMDFLQIGRNAAYRMIKNGEIGSIRIGRLYRIPKICVEQWMKSAYTISAEESSHTKKGGQN